MRAEQQRALQSVRMRVRGFLEFGLVDDPALYARELRGLRTQCTRAIVVLEQPEDGLAAAAGPGPGGVADLAAAERAADAATSQGGSA